jgi:hypothetical protein
MKVRQLLQELQIGRTTCGITRRGPFLRVLRKKVIVGATPDAVQIAAARYPLPDWSLKREAVS